MWGMHTRPGNDPMKRAKENQDSMAIIDCFAGKGELERHILSQVPRVTMHTSWSQVALQKRASPSQHLLTSSSSLRRSNVPHRMRRARATRSKSFTFRGGEPPHFLAGPHSGVRPACGHVPWLCGHQPRPLHFSSRCVREWKYLRGSVPEGKQTVRRKCWGLARCHRPTAGGAGLPFPGTHKRPET